MLCLKQVSPKEVEFASSNPRGESEEETSRDATFERLKDSVYQFGVLVPIVVHEQERGAEKPYRLVDGERRLRAALATGAKKVPAHIAPRGERMDDLIQAVHIHMLRKQWKSVAEVEDSLVGPNSPCTYRGSRSDTVGQAPPET